VVAGARVGAGLAQLASAIKLINKMQTMFRKQWLKIRYFVVTATLLFD
jgi:hypothetical protein